MLVWRRIGHYTVGLAGGEPVAEAVEIERWEVHYEGMVQGVGFRYTTRRVALRFPVTGYVRNLPDGRVRMVAEGEPEVLQGLLDAVAAEMGRYIRRTTRNASPATGEFGGFDIRF